MAINWSTVENQVKQQVAGIVGTAWQNAWAGASTQVVKLIAAAKSVEDNKDTMQQAEYDSLKFIQQNALEGVLQTDAAIAIDVAQKAAAAAWGVATTAIKTAYPAIGLLL
jgi:hypothetical protein